MKKLTALLIALITLFAVAAGCKGKAPANERPKSGYYAVFEVNGNTDVSDGEMRSVMDAIRKRLSDNGYDNVWIEKIDSTSIRVEIPEVENPGDVFKYFGIQGKLEFRDSSGTVWLTGKDVKNAGTGYDENGNPAVTLEFTAEGQKKFKTATAHVSSSSDKKLYIYLGDEQVSVATCEKEIDSKTAQIQLNGGSMEEAKSLASVITSGSFEVDLKMVESGAFNHKNGEEKP